MKMEIVSVVLAFSMLSVCGVAQGAEYHVKNNAWQWVDGGWDEGVNPGPEDTVIVPELAILKSRYDGGKMQSFGLTATQEVQSINFKDLYGINFNGGKMALTLNSVVADDIYPTVDDTAQIATNVISTDYLTFKGATNEVYVGSNHVFRINSVTVDRAADSVLVKKGSGTFWHAGKNWGAMTGTVWVAEGDYIRSGNGYPEFRGDMIVGGGDKIATLLVTSDANSTFLPWISVLDIRSNGRVFLPGLNKTMYQETVKVDHGLLDGGGSSTFYMSNRAETECGTVYTLNGGVVTNATYYITYGGVFKIVPSETMSAIYGSLSFGTAYDIDVPDGTAPVDFLVCGDLGGVNRGINKAGEGTMVIRTENDTISTWGGVAGKAFNVYAGELLVDFPLTGIGMATNNIVVAAGATYGGVGRHVGAYVTNRGNVGNVTLNGEAGNPATFIVGRKDETTGAYTPGTFILGSDDFAAALTMNNECVLKLAVDETGVSKLVVNGTLTLSGNDTLAIVGPEDITGLTPGVYEIVSSSTEISDSFKSCTYNGGSLPGGMKIKATSTSVTLTIPKPGFAISIR